TYCGISIRAVALGESIAAERAGRARGVTRTVDGVVLARQPEALTCDACQRGIRQAAHKLTRFACGMAGPLDACRAIGCGGYLGGVGSEVHDGEQAHCTACGRFHTFFVSDDGAID